MGQEFPRHGVWIVTVAAVLLHTSALMVHASASWHGWGQSSAGAAKTAHFEGPLSSGDGIQWAFNTHSSVVSSALLTSDHSAAIFTDSGPNVYGANIPSSSPSLWDSIWHGVRSPSTRWVVMLDADITTVPALTTDEKAVLVGIAVSDGTVLWKKSFPHTHGFASPITVSPNGEVFVGTDGVRMFSIAESSGDVLWSCSTRGTIVGAPAVGPSGDMLFFSAHDGYVFGVKLGEDNKCAQHKDPPCRAEAAFNVSGCSSWNVHASDDPLNHGPMLDVSTSTLYATSSGEQSGSGALMAFKLDADGMLMNWTTLTKLDDLDITTSPTKISSSVLAFGASDGTLRAMNVSARPVVPKWSHASGGDSVASKAVSNGKRVAYGSATDSVFVLDAASGAQLVQVDVGGSVTASPAVTASGWLVVGDTSGILWCIGGSSPDFLRWRLGLGAAGIVIALGMCVGVYCICLRKKRPKKPVSILNINQSLAEPGVALDAQLSPVNTSRRGSPIAGYHALVENAEHSPRRLFV